MSEWSGRPEPPNPEQPGDVECIVCDRKVRRYGGRWFHVSVTSYRAAGIRRHVARPKPVSRG